MIFVNYFTNLTISIKREFLSSIKERLKEKIEEQKTELEEQKEAKNQLPKKVDVSLLKDYKSFKQIDNDGKWMLIEVGEAPN